MKGQTAIRPTLIDDSMNVESVGIDLVEFISAFVRLCIRVAP
jgi:hypothetical protein